MGSITTGIGLISGIDTAALIDSIIALESTGKTRLQQRLGQLNAQRTALLDINARLLSFKTASSSFRVNRIFQSVFANSSNEDALAATATTFAQPGTYKFIVNRLVSTSQALSRGFADEDTTPLGLDRITFEHGNGRVTRDVELESLNGGRGVDRGRIVITAGTTTTTVDLGDVVRLDEVIDRINGNGVVDVTARIEGNGLVITENGGQALSIADGVGDTTATDLGIAGSDAGGVISGDDISYVSGTTSLRTLNDGNGVLIRRNAVDFSITARNGTVFEIDLGRVDVPIDASTLLEDLNNGAGVTMDGDSATDDLVIIDTAGTEYGVDLTGATTVGQLISRVDTATGGRIALAANATGDGFTLIDSIDDGGDIEVRGGEDAGDDTAEDLGLLGSGTGTLLTGETLANAVDKPRAATLQDVIARINDAVDTGGGSNDGHIVASISPDGSGLTITDTIGGGGNLIIAATAANPDAATDLGIAADVAADSVAGRRILASLGSVLVRNLNGGGGLPAAGTATLAGSTLLADLFQGAGITTNGNGALEDIQVQDRSGATHLIEVDGLSTVQDLIDAFASGTGGAVTLAINGQVLEATNNAAGVLDFVISDANGATAASDLGIAATNTLLDGEVITGGDTDPLPSAVLTIRNRLGATTSVDLSGYDSLSELIDAINAAGAGVIAAVNGTGNGLSITDASGGTGNLVLSGGGATNLGIAADVAADTVQGRNLQLRYVSNASRLEDLNYGRGVGAGSFRITDGLGQTATVNIGGDEETLYDVIREINSRGLAVSARINDNGDGLIIEEDLTNFAGQTPFVAIKVEGTGGTAAADLGILGESAGVEGGFIDGSYEQVVDLAASDSIEDVVQKINEAGINVQASVLSTGLGSAPFRLSLASLISGRRGDLVVDTGGVDIGLSALVRGEDAKVFFGADDPADGFLVSSSTNTVDGVLQGVSIDLLATSEEPVTLSIGRDTDAIVGAVRQFVTTFNDVIGRINEYDFFDVDTEERGILLGDATTARVRSALYRVATGSALNVDSSFRFLSQIGITVNRAGELTFDEEKLRAEYAADPQSVEQLFAAYDVTDSSTTTLEGGITVNESSTTYNALGFGNLFDNLLEELTNSVNGTVTLADDAFGDQIELLNKRIADFDERLERRRAQLQREFAGLETSLARLQEQSNSLLSLSSSVQLASQQLSLS